MTPRVLRLDREAVLARRARVAHLGRRASAPAAAAWGGLQDSAPRSGLLSLHARLAGAGPDSWEDPSLTQVWGPRVAAWLVPAADVDAFTRGRLPRDPGQASALEQAANRVAGALGGEVRTAREVTDAPDLTSPVDLRAPCATGRYRIRWDASMTWVVPAEPPAGDPERARHELLRRFLHWLGPATCAGFAWWAGIAAGEARATWTAIDDELVPVTVGSHRASILASDRAAFDRSGRVSGVRLLPDGDPYLALAGGDLVSGGRRGAGGWAAGRPIPRLPDGSRFIPGAVLVDGEIAGAWSRRQARVTLIPWGRPGRAARDAMAAEAERLAGPLGRPVTVDVLAP